MIHIHKHITGTGVETYSKGLVQGLQSLDKQVYESEPIKKEWVVGGRRIGGFITQRFFSYLQPNNCPVFHAISNWVFCRDANSIMIHDLNPLLLKGWGFQHYMFHRQKKRLRDVTILVPSQSVKQSVVYWLNVDFDNVHVALHGVDHIKKVDSIQDPLGYLFFAGDYRHYKRFFDAVDMAKNLGMKLVRVGPEANDRQGFDSKTYAIKILGSDFTDFGYVSRDFFQRLLANSSANVFLSKYEGFGLPPLEAARLGVPSILADTPVNREIYGEHAFYEEYREATVWQRQKLVNWTDKFTWEKSARIHLKAWEDLL